MRVWMDLKWLPPSRITSFSAEEPHRCLNSSPQPFTCGCLMDGWILMWKLTPWPKLMKKKRICINFSSFFPVSASVWLSAVTSYTPADGILDAVTPVFPSVEMISIRFWKKLWLGWIMNTDCQHIQRPFTPFVQRLSLIFWSLILCPPLSSVFLRTAADFSNNRRRLSLLSLRGPATWNVLKLLTRQVELTLTAELLILHAEKWVKH